MPKAKFGKFWGEWFVFVGEDGWKDLMGPGGVSFGFIYAARGVS